MCPICECVVIFGYYYTFFIAVYSNMKSAQKYFEAQKEKKETKSYPHKKSYIFVDNPNEKSFINGLIHFIHEKCIKIGAKVH